MAQRNLHKPATASEVAELVENKIVERPDGFYWQDQETQKLFGPFATLMEAKQDRDYNADSEFEPGETLEQVEEEIGVSNWIDHETGQPGEETIRLED
jgi:hypothetical protein